MLYTKCLRRLISCLFILCVANTASAQGPPTPPGAPAPTMKTLQQIEPRTPITHIPFIIAEPGSYYFVSNLIAEAGFNTNGITVQVDDVTIDMNGFSLVGPGAVTPSFGIAAGDISGEIVRRNFAVRNGSIANWGAGIWSSGPGVHIESMRILNNYYGLGDFWGLSGFLVSQCIFTSNSSYSIFAASAAHVTDCSFDRSLSSEANSENSLLCRSVLVNKDDSFQRMLLETGSVLKDNQALGGGIRGADSVISGCSAIGASAVGLQSEGSLVCDNYAAHNRYGIFAGRFVIENLVVSNEVGVAATERHSVIVKNAAQGNTITNYDFGNNTRRFGTIDSGMGVLVNDPWANFEY